MTKKELKIEFEGLLTSLDKELTGCRINRAQYVKFLRSPYKYLHFRRLLKWVQGHLVPTVLEYKKAFQLRSEESWDILKSMNKNHPDIVFLEAKIKNVREAWQERPMLWNEES